MISQMSLPKRRVRLQSSRPAHIKTNTLASLNQLSNATAQKNGVSTLKPSSRLRTDFLVDSSTRQNNACGESSDCINRATKMECGGRLYLRIEMSESTFYSTPLCRRICHSNRQEGLWLTNKYQPEAWRLHLRIHWRSHRRSCLPPANARLRSRRHQAFLLHVLE